MYRSVPVTLSLALCVACAPLPVDGEGEEGKLRYELSTQTAVSGQALDEVAILTGSEQTIEAELTWSASWFADNDDDFWHALGGDCDADWETGREDPERLPTLWISVPHASQCELETWRDDRAYDRITLRFDDLADIGVEARVYWPGETASEELEEIPQTLPVGSAISLDPFPMAADGSILAGHHDIELEIDTWAGLDISFFDLLFGSPYSLDEPGLVSFMFYDDHSGVSRRISFVVVDEG